MVEIAHVGERPDIECVAGLRVLFEVGLELFKICETSDVWAPGPSIKPMANDDASAIGDIANLGEVVGRRDLFPVQRPFVRG
jgi:hypothetical protein